jgi:hypothetical protein
MSGDHNAGRSHNLKNNRSFVRVEECRYLRTTLTHLNSIQEETKGGRVQIFENNVNASKFYSGRT